MTDTLRNEFPQNLTKFFLFNGKVFPRGGLIKKGKRVVILGSTLNYIIGLRQLDNDLTVVEVPTPNMIPIPPRNITTVDDLLIHAYNVIFTPKYAEIVNGNKTIAVGIIYSKYISDKGSVYWLYDIEEGIRTQIEIGKKDNIIIKYVEMPQDELNQIIKKIFNFEGLKEILKQYLQHGLFTLDSYGE
jgi:hypothetical protein